jgi:hypothetical protein
MLHAAVQGGSLGLPAAWLGLSRIVLHALGRTAKGLVSGGPPARTRDKAWTPGDLVEGALECFAAVAALMAEADQQPRGDILWVTRHGHGGEPEPVNVRGLLPDQGGTHGQRARLERLRRETNGPLASRITVALWHADQMRRTRREVATLQRRLEVEEKRANPFGLPWRAGSICAETDPVLSHHLQVLQMGLYQHRVDTLFQEQRMREIAASVSEPGKSPEPEWLRRVKTSRRPRLALARVAREMLCEKEVQSRTPRHQEPASGWCLNG